MTIPSLIYFWGFKPDEVKNPPVDIIQKNQDYYKDYEIIGPSKALELVSLYGFEELYLAIPNQAWVIKADLARLLYVYYNGQIYLDVDCKISKDFHEIWQEHEVLLFKESYLWNLNKLGEREMKIRTRVANYAFGSNEQEHPFFKVVLDEAIKRLNYLLNVEKLTVFSHSDILWVCGTRCNFDLLLST